MTTPVPLVVAGILVRETLRALATPLHVLAFLARRKGWAALARATLESRQTGSEGPWNVRALAPRGTQPRLFVSAGEASGELHAARLVAEVRRARPDLEVTCFGGRRLEAAGARLLWPLADHAVMGITAVLASLPFFVRAVARFVRFLREERPDLVVLVDYPGLHLVFAELCRKHGVPAVHYVAPQYWAWGPWRMRRYAHAFAGTLTILPFEPAWFERFGIASRYVGHPLLDHVAATPPDPRASARFAGAELLVLLPGSRTKEIRAHLPGMLGVARTLAAQRAGLRVVVVQSDPRKAALARELVAAGAAAGAPSAEVVEGDPATALGSARLVLAKSGTGSLEAVLRGAPTIVVYNVASALGKALYERLVVMPFFASANLVAARAAFPEFGFAHARGWDAVAARAQELLRDGPARDAVLAATALVRERLGGPGATARAAACVTSAFDPTNAPK